MDKKICTGRAAVPAWRQGTCGFGRGSGSMDRSGRCRPEKKTIARARSGTPGCNE
ncbi:MAG: hypothetical protein WCB46_00105 [Methanoregula sp.]